MPERALSSHALFSIERFAATLTTLAVGRQVTYLRETNSTMDVAAELAARGAAHGSIVLAEEQTSGRGRRGRSFFSPPGENLYFTLVLRPDGESLRRLPVALPLAVCRACRTAGVEALIKWPNDIWIGVRKVSGMLIDAQGGPSGNVALPGIGINVNGDPTVNPELAHVATSLRRERGAPVDREPLLAAFCNELERALQLEALALTEGYRELSMILGRPIAVQSGSAPPWHGTAEAIAPDGSLVVRRDSGVTETISAAEVTIRPAER